MASLSLLNAKSKHMHHETSLQTSDRFKGTLGWNFHEGDTKDKASVMINLDMISFHFPALDTQARLDGAKLPSSSSASHS
jgi:hypothetical protein